MGRVEGKVALVTGAARGQGRAHAVRLAEEGADIIACDFFGEIPTIGYPRSRSADLAETVREIESLDRRIVSDEADVRDRTDLERLIQRGVSELGRLDIVCANAGVLSYAPALELEPEAWQTVIDVNLTGVFNTIQLAGRQIVAAGNGGSMVLISSFGGLRGIPNAAHYSASKHGVLGLSRVFAQELATHFIRVNSVHPGAVRTPMVDNAQTLSLFGSADATLDDAREEFARLNALPVGWVEPRDISEAVLWLASDESRYVTGVALPIDAGSLVKMPG